MKLEIKTAHPSVEALDELMTHNEWEALAALSSEGVATRMPDEDMIERLRARGLVGLGGHLTAAAYALLFRWLRQNRCSTKLLKKLRQTPDERRHFYRMNLLLLHGAPTPQQHPPS